MKVFCILLFYFFSSSLFSQKSGAITYSILPIAFETESKGEQKSYTDQMIKMAESQTFTLQFSGVISYFFQDPKMYDAMEEMENNIASSAFTSGNSHYVDILKEQHISKSREGLLIDQPYRLNWLITKETKKIGDYLCYKATQIVEYESNDGTRFLKTITAWFAPSLPYSFGPINYYGLPGLILELTDRHTTFVATRIKIDSKNSANIEWPKGKIVSKKEFDLRQKSN